MLSAFDYFKAAFSAVSDVVKATVEEQKQKAEPSSVVVPDDESEVTVPEVLVQGHPDDLLPYKEYIDLVRASIRERENSGYPCKKREDTEFDDEELYRYVLDNKRWDKSNEEIGKDYERFIAYQCTIQGYHVIPHGILLGKNDGGIDLIAKKGNQTLVIQCKYWGNGKVLHENCVTQLYGSCHAYQRERHCNGDDVLPVLVTNITLDDVAKKRAELLNVLYMEQVYKRTYPLVKCCEFRGRNGQYVKLYFLPSDKAYDAADIESENTFYAYSAREAAQRGFYR